jgi:imidazole glycerol-phosphate synthase subunit HisH
VSARVAILDYGMGNLRSAEKAFEHVGATVTVTRDHDAVRAADGIVLPGVGAFPKAMRAVRELGFDALISERLEQGVPVLGICLGMQLLFDSSSEHEGAEGLGLLPGRVERLDAPGLKIPEIGWNPVSWRRQSPLAEGLPEPCPMYHVHSYSPRPAREEDVLGTATYGSEFVSAVERAPVYGTQFHPEKSSEHGLRLLQNFTRIAASALRRAA